MDISSEWYIKHKRKRTERRAYLYQWDIKLKKMKILINVEVEQIKILSKEESKMGNTKSAILANAVKGVSEGFSKNTWN